MEKPTKKGTTNQESYLLHFGSNYFRKPKSSNISKIISNKRKRKN